MNNHILSENIVVEKMTLDDLNSISSILQSDFDDFWNYNILKSELENTDSIYLVCKIDDEIIGFAGITIILDTAELNNIVIKKSYRNNGLSKILLSKLIDFAKLKNCIYLNLEVSAKNSIAIKLYKSFGFEEVGLRKKYYNGVDALLLTKVLVTIQ